MPGLRRRDSSHEERRPRLRPRPADRAPAVPAPRRPRPARGRDPGVPRFAARAVRLVVGDVRTALLREL